MPYMLRVAAFQIDNPLSRFILTKPDDSHLHLPLKLLCNLFLILFAVVTCKLL